MSATCAHMQIAHLTAYRSMPTCTQTHTPRTHPAMVEDPPAVEVARAQHMHQPALQKVEGGLTPVGSPACQHHAIACASNAPTVHMQHSLTMSSMCRVGRVACSRLVMPPTVFSESTTLSQSLPLNSKGEVGG